MSTKGIKLKSVPIFQNKELVRFVKGRNLNLPELNHLLIDLKSICVQTKQSKCKVTSHSKRVLNEIKFINKVINNSQPNNDNIDTTPTYDKATKLKEGVSVLKINQWNEGYKCPTTRRILLDKISNSVQERNEVNHQHNVDFPKTNLVDYYPKILPYRNHTVDNSIRNCVLSERQSKRLNEINITENVPDISGNLKEKKNYLALLRNKYFAKLPKYFK